GQRPRPRERLRSVVQLHRAEDHFHQARLTPARRRHATVSDTLRESDTNITGPSHGKPHTSRCLSPEGCQTPPQITDSTASDTLRPYRLRTRPLRPASSDDALRPPASWESSSLAQPPPHPGSTGRGVPGIRAAPRPAWPDRRPAPRPSRRPWPAPRNR